MNSVVPCTRASCVLVVFVSCVFMVVVSDAIASMAVQHHQPWSARLGRLITMRLQSLTVTVLGSSVSYTGHALVGANVSVSALGCGQT